MLWEVVVPHVLVLHVLRWRRRHGVHWDALVHHILVLLVVYRRRRYSHILLHWWLVLHLAWPWDSIEVHMIKTCLSSWRWSLFGRGWGNLVVSHESSRGNIRSSWSFSSEGVVEIHDEVVVSVVLRRGRILKSWPHASLENVHLHLLAVVVSTHHHHSWILEPCLASIIVVGVVNCVHHRGWHLFVIVDLLILVVLLLEVVFLLLFRHVVDSV